MPCFDKALTILRGHATDRFTKERSCGHLIQVTLSRHPGSPQGSRVAPMGQVAGARPVVSCSGTRSLPPSRRRTRPAGPRRRATTATWNSASRGAPRWTGAHPGHGARSWRGSWPTPNGCWSPRYPNCPTAGTSPSRISPSTWRPVVAPDQPRSRPAFTARNATATDTGSRFCAGPSSSRERSVTTVPCDRSMSRPHRQPASPGRIVAGGPGLAGQRGFGTLSGLVPGGQTSLGPSGAVGPAPDALSAGARPEAQLLLTATVTNLIRLWTQASV